MDACILNIQRFSTHDGPGIRTTVFFKGCTNACQWCHNPESLSSEPQVEQYPDRCIGCGKCLQLCPVGAHEVVDGVRVYHRDRCKGCGKCTDECYAQALRMAGQTMSVDALMAEVLKDELYYRKPSSREIPGLRGEARSIGESIPWTGGLTFSGGEPVLAGEFLEVVLGRCKELGLHTCIQTAGNVAWGKLEPLLDGLSLVMYDLKAHDPEVHKRFVGSKPELIRENLKRLSEHGVPIIVRTPVVGGVNATREEIEGIARFASGLRNVLYYELMPYHNLGNSKRAGLGMEPGPVFVTPSREEMGSLADAASAFLPTRIA